MTSFYDELYDPLIALILLIGVISIPPILGIRLMYTVCWLVYTLLAYYYGSPSAVGISTAMSLTIMIGWYSLQAFDPFAWSALLRGWLGIWSKFPLLSVTARIMDVLAHIAVPLFLLSTSISKVRLWMGVASLGSARLWSWIVAGGIFPRADHVYGFYPPRSKQFWDAAYKMEVILDLFVPCVCVIAKQDSSILYIVTAVVATLLLSVQVLRSMLLPTLQSHAATIMKKLLEEGGIQIGTHIVVHDDEFWLEWLTGGMLSIGESYMAQQWDAESISLDILIAKLQTLPAASRRAMFRSWDARIIALTARLFKYPSSSRRSIVGNVGEQFNLEPEFFERYLDTYLQPSCAQWDDGLSLNEAQLQKMDSIASTLSLKSGMHFLEITKGGVGGLSCYLAQKYEIQATCIVSSQVEKDYAIKIAEKFGVSNKINLVVSDFRKIKLEQVAYDGVVTFGVVNTIKPVELKKFLDSIRNSMKPHAKGIVEFCGTNRLATGCQLWVNRYIFPDTPNMFLSYQQFNSAIEGSFHIENMQLLGDEFDKTFMAWHERFQSQLKELWSIPHSFIRTWEFYLLHSAACYRVKNVQLYQVVLSRI